jgi:hypothetical protein
MPDSKEENDSREFVATEVKKYFDDHPQEYIDFLEGIIVSLCDKGYDLQEGISSVFIPNEEWSLLSVAVWGLYEKIRDNQRDNQTPDETPEVHDTGSGL